MTIGTVSSRTSVNTTMMARKKSTGTHLNQCATVAPAPLNSHAIAHIATGPTLAIAITVNAIPNNDYHIRKYHGNHH